MANIVLDNEILEKAIDDIMENQDMEHLMAVVDTLCYMAKKGSRFLVPVDVYGEDEEVEIKSEEDGFVTNSDQLNFRMKHISMDDKSEFLAAFTSEEAFKSGPETPAVVSSCGQLIGLANSREDIAGLVINPWTKPFLVKQELIDMVITMVSMDLAEEEAAAEDRPDGADGSAGGSHQN